MMISIESAKTVAELRESLPQAAAAHKFGVLGVHDLAAKMKEKGVEFSGEVLVFEVCNPHKAKAVLEASPQLSSFLPCRISVYKGTDGKTRLTTIRPTALMEVMGAKDLLPVAIEVERELDAIMRAAS